MSTPQPIKPSEIVLKKHNGLTVYGWPSMPRLGDMPRKAIITHDWCVYGHPTIAGPKPMLQFAGCDSVRNNMLHEAFVFWTLKDCYLWLCYQSAIFYRDVLELVEMEDE